MSTLASLLADRANAQPNLAAMHYPTGRDAAGLPTYATLSYAQLDARVDALASGFVHAGIGPGCKTAVLVRPGPDLTAVMFALFRVGAVPVLIDPGIDRAALKACLAEAAPQAFIGIPLAHVARLVLGWAKDSIRILVTAGSLKFWKGPTLADLETQGRAAPVLRSPPDDDALAAVVFTSGSTGIPKGVEYSHRMFVAQITLLAQVFDFAPGEPILQTFPPFALFDPALGTTTVVPDMDPTRPARADPRKLIAAIEQFQIRAMFGSPALLRTLSAYMLRQRLQLPSLRRVLSAGAPVPPDLVADVMRWAPPDCKLYTPYGATEALPVAVIEGREVLRASASHAAGVGICVGQPVPGNTVRIIAISDAPIASMADAQLMPTGEIGEITVSGPSTTRCYHGRPKQTALAKIADGDHVVHRMGDVGYLDEAGMLWYCGRKSHRVESAHGPLYSEACEQVFNQHAGVRRSALVGVGPRRSRPVIVVELMPGQHWSDALQGELLELAQRYRHTQHINTFLAHAGFPVDIRHNSKIGREKLEVYAHNCLDVAPDFTELPK